MYKSLTDAPVSAAHTMPDHLSMANSFAKEAIERFEPHLVNEMIKAIRQRIAEQRTMEIEKGEKHLQYLRESLSDL